MTTLKQCRVLVTPRSYGKDDPSLKTDLEQLVGEVVYNTTERPLTSEELASMIHDFDGMIAGLDAIDRTVIEAAQRLKVIARYGVGVDQVDLAAAQAQGIIVTNTPGANAVSVAELAIGLMLSLARNIPAAVETTHAGSWPRMRGTTLEGKVIGLLGLGAIGKQVARRLTGFSCVVLAYDPVVEAADAKAYGAELRPRNEVIQQADFLSLHLPVLPDTRNMVNAEFLRQMKPGAYLVNTARGELVDEEALYDALQSGHLRGAALDDFQQEPPGADHPLLALPQVIATPHMGGQADGATNAMGRMALNDCLAVLRGEEPAHRVVRAV
jgi:D-3-phosphoglycerate dehydrogenase